MSEALPTIEVRYECAACGIADGAVTITALPDFEALLGVSAWVDGIVTPAVSANHAARSPDCAGLPRRTNDLDLKPLREALRARA